MDAARCAKRMGAENVTIAYRRSEAELPPAWRRFTMPRKRASCSNSSPPRGAARRRQGTRAEDGVHPDGAGRTRRLGRRRPVPVEGSNFEIDADCVIVAIGTTPNPLIRATTKGLETNRWGCIVTDEETGATSREGVFAGGDIATGAATVILAMGAGKRAAAAIDQYIQSK